MNSDYRFIAVQQEQDNIILAVNLQRISEFEMAHELGNELVAAVRQHPAHGVVVDMRNVEYLASVGYGPLISLRSCVKQTGQRLVLCNLAKPLKHVLTATRMLINPQSQDALFEYADSLDEALEMLAGQS